MSISRHFVLAAGGTGGHMIPAHAVAQELMARGHHVALVTDERGAKIPGIFEDAAVHVLPAGRLQGGPLGWAKALRGILAGREMARRMYSTFQPSVVVGFGGYPALPALLGALKDDIPTVIHEQNAVLGRVNRFLARKPCQFGNLPDGHISEPLHGRLQVLAQMDELFSDRIIGGAENTRDVRPPGLALHGKRKVPCRHEYRSAVLGNEGMTVVQALPVRLYLRPRLAGAEDKRNAPRPNYIQGRLRLLKGICPRMEQRAVEIRKNHDLHPFIPLLNAALRLEKIKKADKKHSSCRPPAYFPEGPILRDRLQARQSAKNSTLYFLNYMLPMQRMSNSI